MRVFSPPFCLRFLPLLLGTLLLLVGCDGSGSGSSDTEFTASPGWHWETIDHKNQIRDFRYYVPESFEKDAPAVLALHGATRGAVASFGENAESGSLEWINIAEENGLLLVTPNASQDSQPVWNDCTDLPNRPGNPDDSGFLRKLADWTETKADVDPDRLYVYGVSNGGQMANRLAIEHPDRFSGIAAVISNINANLGEDKECPKPSSPIPIVIVSGKTDQITPFEGGSGGGWPNALLSAEDTRDLWVANNIQGSPPSPQPAEYTKDISGASCEITVAPNMGADVQLCAFDGGHTVPDGAFNPARAAWEFFRDQ